MIFLTSCIFYLFVVFFQVGTDIIYTLSCVWDFKQEMLVTTIKDGLLEVRPFSVYDLTYNS